MNTEHCFSVCRLADAFAEVRSKSATPGVDGVSPEAFAGDLDRQLTDLSSALISGDYQPSSLLRMAIPKPSGGSRQLGIATVRDRIVLYRLRHILSRPIESTLTSAAFAYRPGRSAQAAVARVAEQLRSGKEWVLLTDIQDFFDRVPIRAVSSALAQLSIEPEIVSIAERLLWAHALSDEKGLAQGSPLSPLLSNLVLTPIDRTLDLPARPLVRYCDNLLAVRPRLASGSTLLGVIDIDAAEPKVRTAAQAYAEALSTVARSWELHALLEDTGGRGFHLWLPLRDRVGVDAVHSCLTALCRTAGSPADGVTIEILPGPAHAPETHSQVIALPMGVHPVTQQRSRMHWLSGREVAPDLLALLDAPLNPPHQLLGRGIPARTADAPARSAPTPQSSLQPVSPTASEVAAALPDWLVFGEEVHKLMTGCGLLSHLAQKARAVGHLTHAERLSVLYSLGHLGESGEQAIHAVVSPCRNYDPKETARQIAKLGGIPIGCSRLREKHAITDELRAQCGCSFSVQRLRGGYPTPLLHIGRFRRTWLEVLRGRKAARSGPTAPRIPVVVEDIPSAITPADLQSLDEPTSDGLRLQTIPPHEWA